MLKIKNIILLPVFVGLLFVFFASPVPVLADPPGRGIHAEPRPQNVQGVVVDKVGNDVTASFTYMASDGSYRENVRYTFTLSEELAGRFNVGSNIYFVYDTNRGTADTATVSETPYSTKFGFSSTLFNVTCPVQTEAVKCWLAQLFAWSQKAIFVLSIGATIFAGIWWMTSAGNPQRITFAKKVLWGAVSGVLVIVLGKLFLTYFIGVSWL